MQLVPEAMAQVIKSSDFGSIVNPIISNVVYPLIELMFAVAVVVFAYGVVQMIAKGDDASAREKGSKSMMGGVIGMFIMVSAWGIIYLVAHTVGQIGK